MNAKRISLFAACCIAGLSVGHAQPYPTDLFTCQESCRFPVNATVHDCDFAINMYALVGFVVFGPLEYRGPIRVAVNARKLNGKPLLVQYRKAFVPAEECSPTRAGIVIWETTGTRSCHPDSLWQQSPWMELLMLTPGDAYWMQLEGFMYQGEPDDIVPLEFSAAANCIRVESRASATIPRTWGLIKTLFR